MDRKAEFLKIWTERVQRDYADALLAWLERETDFFEAPASTSTTERTLAACWNIP